MTNTVVIDAYHGALIERGAAVFHTSKPKATEPAADEEETDTADVETKVVTPRKPGRPRKSTEGVETK